MVEIARLFAGRKDQAQIIGRIAWNRTGVKFIDEDNGGPDVRLRKAKNK